MYCNSIPAGRVPRTNQRTPSTVGTWYTIPCSPTSVIYNELVKRVGRAAPRPETTKKKKDKKSKDLIEVIDVNGRTRYAKSITPDESYPGFMKITYRSHHEWYSIPEFLENNPDLKSYTKDAPELPQDTVGVVTSSGKDYLRDSTQNWKSNTFAGYYVWISRGKGEGQKRTILKNTHNKLTVDKAWETPPNKTSQYVISYNIHEVRPMGNTLAAEDIKEYEKKAIQLDKKRGRLNKNVKYLTPEEALKV